MSEWVSITTMEYRGRCEIELEIFTNRIRHRKIYVNGAMGEWSPGEPNLIRSKKRNAYEKDNRKPPTRHSHQ